MEAFACGSEDLEKVSQEIIKKENIIYPNVHFELDQMIKLSKAVKIHKCDSFVHIPFCLTVEAEHLGGAINLGNDRVGPRVKECIYKNVSDLLNIDYDIAFTSGRIKTVLDAVKILSLENDVILNVNGIFTLLSSLIDINILYKAMRKEKENVLLVFEKIKDYILRFVDEGLKNGAKVISYADPVGDVKIMGLKTFLDFSAPITYDILKNISSKMDDEILFLCGRMTNGLNQAKLIEIIPFSIENVKNYGEALLKISKENNINIFGNYCIKRTHFPGQNVKACGIKLL